MTSALRACAACRTPLPDEAQFCLRCGAPTPTEPGVPPRTAATGVVEVDKVRQALAGRYRIEHVLGEGGMATVYLAEDLKHNRKVAVKVMRPELAATLGADRFLREVQVAARLNHPHILPMHDSGEADGVLYYVMPYVEGQTLAERMGQEGQLSVQEAVRLGREVAEALAYAHAQGIVHRDIKPGNILLQSGHALVADFGIARALGNEGQAALTMTGLAVGTPQYMAPEQATGDRDVDGRADLYALGAVMYEMVAGEPPFTGPTARAILTRSLTETVRPLSISRAGLSPLVDSAVMKALAKSPSDRYADGEAMVTALDRALEGVRSGSNPIGVAGPGPTPQQVWGLFALGSMGMLALVFGLIRQWSLPGWTLGLAVALLAVGGLVLVLTSRMEDARREGGTPSGLGRFFTWRFAAMGGGLAFLSWAVVAMALVFQGPGGGGATAATGGTHLAILPFENQGSDEDAYFADGIGDEVRGKLARINGITVIASSSAGQYRTSAKTPQEIARELGADYLLIGKVRWAAGANGVRRVQVAPELVDGRTGATTWQQNFDSDVTDLFEMQSQIASRVAGALGAQLGAQEVRDMAARPTANVAAYDLYLKGKALTSVDAGTMRQAAGFYEQAVALDSTFVDAWAALSESLSRVYFNGSREPSVGARAKVAMERAIALAPNSPSGYIGAVRYYGLVDVDVTQAAAAMGRALQLAPNDSEVLTGAAGVDLREGRLELAAEKLERAREIDPRSAETLGSLQQVYIYQRRFAEARDVGEAVMALVPGDINLVEWQAMGHAAQGDLQGARAVIRAAIVRGNPAPAVAAFFGGYQEVSWLLDDAERNLLFRLTPAAFDNDRAWWGQTMATSYWQQGNKALALAYADSGLAATAAQLAASPNDGQTQGLYGMLLGYLGRKAEAIDHGLRAVASEQAGAGNTDYHMILLTRIYLAVGEPDKAIDQLEVLAEASLSLHAAVARDRPHLCLPQGHPAL